MAPPVDAERPRWVVHGRGLAALSTLPALLNDVQLLTPRQASSDGAQAVLAWGRKPSARRAQAWALARGLPTVQVEDGFLRSVGLGGDEPPWSLVLDDLGVYYDASAPSRLEVLIAGGADPDQTRRALALQQAWCQARVSKYNHAREAPAAVPQGAVLLVDQTAGDVSIHHGQATAASFTRMLEAALDEHPGLPLVLKTHPDVVAGRKAGCLGSLSPAQRQRVTVLAQDVHPPGLLERVSAVYTVTSQLGFEALLWGLPLRCFGMPFYAGWGLSQDDLPAPPRRGPASLANLVHAALVAYPRYLQPEIRERCEPEQLLHWLALQRRQRERFPAQVSAVGFSMWKRPIVRRFLAGSEVRFAHADAPLPPGQTVVLWGDQPAPGAAAGHPVLRLEDGFLRSVGLGAELRQPLSWVQDRRGLYYDARQPSDLEVLLQESSWTPELLARAAALRERILTLGLSKYNLGGPAWQRPAQARPLVLVVGQVESDAALRHSAPGVHTNIGLLQAVRVARPDAWLIWKPHPDVVAKLRRAGREEELARRHCDEVVLDAPIPSLLDQVDEVHVLTSLTGFEALLRGRRVVCWGTPFYAGWGLTVDQHPVPRRTRRLSLDALVAGVLLLYPAYVSRQTGHFTTPERALEELQAWRQLASQAGLGKRAWHQALRTALRLAQSLRQPPK
jgi:capsular polysaccharide export protein